VQRRGAARAPNIREALDIFLGALSSITRTSGVKTINIEVDGKPAALTIIENVAFGEDPNGNTILEEKLETNPAGRGRIGAACGTEGLG
jgi:hypothetical protein